LESGEGTQDLRPRHGATFGIGRVKHRAMTDAFRDLLQAMRELERPFATSRRSGVTLREPASRIR